MNSTKIEWTSKTWNPVTGCPGPKVSPGCEHCYAERTALTRLRGRFGFDADDPFGIHVFEERLLQPYTMKKSTNIFVCSMGDLFHQWVPADMLSKIFSVMALCPQHTFMVLTKRPDRMHDFITDTSTLANDRRGLAYVEMAGRAGADTNMDGLPWPLPNVRVGVTVCNQPEAEEKISWLLKTPAAKRFVSVEPMLGPVNLDMLRYAPSEDLFVSALRGFSYDIPGYDNPALDWVICGGETGLGARPMHPDWVRNLRDQCQNAGTPFFFKGWGEWYPAEYEAAEDMSFEAEGLVLPDGRFVDYAKGGDDDEFWDESGVCYLVKLRPYKSEYRNKIKRNLDGRWWNEVPS